MAIHLRRDSQVIQMAEHVCPKREKVSGDTGQTRKKGQRIKKMHLTNDNPPGRDLFIPFKPRV